MLLPTLKKTAVDIRAKAKPTNLVKTSRQTPALYYLLQLVYWTIRQTVATVNCVRDIAHILNAMGDDARIVMHIGKQEICFA
jgi:hypothetical protein